LTSNLNELENFGKEKLEGAELDLERMRGKYNKKND
jgi:chromosome condensin MukBEF ATPase and DNA-binding subunit MukB